MAGIESLTQKDALEKDVKQLSTEIEVGEARVQIRTALPEETQIRITVETIAPKGQARKTITLGADPRLNTGGERIRLGSRLHAGIQGLRGSGLEGVLLALALLLYLATRLYQISSYPIYFFTDEAVQTVLAADLVRDGFHFSSGEFLPAYFYNGYQYNLGTSVYLQVLPYLLFGKTIAITRGLAAVTTLFAAISLGLILWKVFKLPHAWSAVLMLSITPAWFLHSRTAFETGLGVTFFAVFLFFYLMYRTRSPRYLYSAVLAGALTFYSYSPARVVIILSGMLLLFSDLRYHIQQRKTVMLGFGLLLLTAIPLIRFQILHPTASMDHLRVLNSYWIQPVPAVEKALIYLKEYVSGLNPLYWYWPNTADMERHKMNGYGHVFWFTFPFFLAGLVVAVRNLRKPAYRTLLLALLAAPAGAALVALGITRALIMVIPLALISALGLVWLMTWFSKKIPAARSVLPLVVFALLAGVNIFMTRNALSQSPYWHQDYGLGGMQWGAQQLFTEIRTVMAETPERKVIVSPSWANGTDTVAQFFFSNPLPFQMGSIEGYFHTFTPVDDQTLFVMIPEEYDRMLESGKFSDVHVEKILPYPNGQPGFYFVTLQYVNDIQEILAAEKEERKALLEETVSVGEEAWAVKYSYLDMGSIDKVFDNDPQTLIRTMEANPLVVETAFPAPRLINWLDVRVGGTPTSVKLILTDSEGQDSMFTQTVEESPTPRSVIFSLQKPVDCVQMRVEVLSTRDQEPAHVHLWEIDSAAVSQGGEDG